MIEFFQRKVRLLPIPNTPRSASMTSFQAALRTHLTTLLTDRCLFFERAAFDQPWKRKPGVLLTGTPMVWRFHGNQTLVACFTLNRHRIVLRNHVDGSRVRCGSCRVLPSWPRHATIWMKTVLAIVPSSSRMFTGKQLKLRIATCTKKVPASIT